MTRSYSSADADGSRQMVKYPQALHSVAMRHHAYANQSRSHCAIYRPLLQCDPLAEHTFTFNLFTIQYRATSVAIVAIDDHANVKTALAPIGMAVSVRPRPGVVDANKRVRHVDGVGGGAPSSANVRALGPTTGARQTGDDRRASVWNCSSASAAARCVSDGAVNAVAGRSTCQRLDDRFTRLEDAVMTLRPLNSSITLRLILTAIIQPGPAFSSGAERIKEMLKRRGD